MHVRRWWMLALAGLVLLAGHLAALYFLRAHFALSALVMAGLIVLVVIVHRGRR